MSFSAFISYSRRNRPYAERLYADLRRTGLDVWLDLSDIPPGEDFEARILPEIARRSHILLLASPESRESEWVRREVGEAQRLNKRIVPLRLAGRPGEMLADWERLNMIENAVVDYWGAVQKLATALNSPQQVSGSLTELLNRRQGSVAQIAEQMGGSRVTATDGRTYWKLPVAPSGYGMTWMFAPADALLGWPSSLGVLFNFTSNYPGTRHLESLAHWAEQVSEPWLVMVEGPMNPVSRSYELSADQPHEWADAVDAGKRVMEEFVRGRQVGFYFNCLVPLAFELGLQSTVVSNRRRVYHYNSRPPSGATRYEIAFDGWK